MTHHDPDLGLISTHYTDDGDIEIHRESAATGLRTVLPLGITAVATAMEILTLSGQASAMVVQRIANTLQARADAGDCLSVAEMRGIVATLRCGVSVPVRVSRPVVVSFGRVG